MNLIEANAIYRLAESGDSSIAIPVKEAIQVIEDALDSYGEHLALSFNGGKDCTVLLHIYAAVLRKRRGQGQTSPSPIPTIYIPMPSPFPEMEAFIEQAAVEYGLDIFRVPCAEGSSGKKGMKEALTLYGHVKPGVKAILIGIRRGDPFSDKLTHKDMTDKDWPEFMRIHPIINWTYSQVWRFLRALEVNYCSLYDQGYTSLGSTYDTYPNPALKVEPDGDNHSHPHCGAAMFKPAYELQDGSLERCGRITVKPTSHLSIQNPGQVQETNSDRRGCNRLASPVVTSPTAYSIKQLHT